MGCLLARVVNCYLGVPLEKIFQPLACIWGLEKHPFVQAWLS